MTTLEAALDYIGRGWSVFPLVPGEKRPSLPIRGFLSGETRWDEAHAKHWWTEHPDDGIAIVTGKPSGLVVIDVDPRNGGDHMTAGADVDGTTSAVTGGLGVHFFCPHPGGHVPCGKTARPGVDRKADGGYVVAAPSVHPSGARYAWAIPPHGNLRPAPAWVFQSPPRSADSGTGEDVERGPWVAETLLHPERCTPGGQEETLTRLAFWASKHLPARDIAFATLMQWASRLPLGNPHDPWTEQHVTDRLDRAYQKRALEPEVGKVAGVVDDTKAPRRKLRDCVATAKAYAAAVEERDDWIVQDFVAPGAYTEIIGVMKEGKSTLVGGMLRALTQGTSFLGRPTKKTKALWVTEQAGMSYRKTLERAQLQDSDDCFVLTIADTYGLPWEEAASEAIDIAIEQGCGVIIIDTLARLAGLTEEDEARSVLCLNPFLKARAAGLAVIFVRHGRKAGGAVNVAARGSGAITGEMDICLLIRATVGVASNYRSLEGVSRLGDVIEEHLRYEDGTYVQGEPPKSHHHAQRDENTAKVVAALEPVQPKPVAKLKELTGLSDTTIRRVLTELERGGAIVAREGGFVLAAADGVTE